LILAMLAGPADSLLPGDEALEARGRWVLDALGKSTPPGSFTRGAQTSGLTYGAGMLWSIGDQRSRYPGCLFRLDPANARFAGKPLRLRPKPHRGTDAAFGEYLRIPNSDFEGLAFHPGNPSVLFAVTEDKVPWIAEIHLVSPEEAHLVGLTPVGYPRGLEPWRDDTNFRLEGVTLSADGGTLYSAFERSADDFPRLLRMPLARARGGEFARFQDVSLPLRDIAGRGDKPRARLNMNGLQWISTGTSSALLAVARDQERILVARLDEQQVVAIDLDLRSPEGKRIKWVSPEGIAADPSSNRLWIVNDPDSVRGNYRARDDTSATGQFAQFTPLLFELKLSEVMERATSTGS
jgi:hypothetical protein